MDDVASQRVESRPWQHGGLADWQHEPHVKCSILTALNVCPTHSVWESPFNLVEVSKGLQFRGLDVVFDVNWIVMRSNIGQQRQRGTRSEQPRHSDHFRSSASQIIPRAPVFILKTDHQGSYVDGICAKGENDFASMTSDDCRINQKLGFHAMLCHCYLDSSILGQPFFLLRGWTSSGF